MPMFNVFHPFSREPVGSVSAANLKEALAKARTIERIAPMIQPAFAPRELGEYLERLALLDAKNDG